MEHALQIEIQPQPNDSACGPTCLEAVYRYWRDPVDLSRLIAETKQLESGGTLSVQLACHALKRGYSAQLTTYNLTLFDPSWFSSVEDAPVGVDLSAKLRMQLAAKQERGDIDLSRLRAATEAYLDFLELGGSIQMLALDENLIVSSLAKQVPILCGLSATYLYQEPRERIQMLAGGGYRSVADDIRGDPTGHFVVLHGYDRQSGNVLIADPLHPNPMAPTNKYAAPMSRVTSAILLSIVTYDANLLTLTPRREREGNSA